MSRLTDTARSAVERSQRTASLPDWWVTAGGALLAVLLLGLIVQFLGSTSSESSASGTEPQITEPLTPGGGNTPPIQPSQEPTQQTSQEPTSTPSEPATPAPTPTQDEPVPSGPVYTVAEGNGRGQIAVPVAANDFARSALRAMYAGAADKVPVAPGSKPAPNLGKFSSPQLSDVTAAIDTGAGLQLFFVLDPDGPGQTTERTVSIHVVPQGSSYAVVVK